MVLQNLRTESWTYDLSPP